MSTPVSPPLADESYEDFYGFTHPPFALAPDPRFLYLAASHDEAIRDLRQSIHRREGFIVLAGDIGTGKTTLCRALLGQLNETTFTSVMLNPYVTVEDLLRDLLLDFGVVSRQSAREGRLAGATTHDLIGTLHEFLLSLVPIHGSAVLIIDEAHHLSPAVLEQIRILSNLETNEAKLLQIVLVGQLSLLETLAKAELRQLNQRISLRAMLEPLSRDEADAYIAHRLRIAGATQPAAFAPAALAAVYSISRGIPRVINLLCDRSLMIAARKQRRPVDAVTVGEAATRLGLPHAGAGVLAPTTLSEGPSLSAISSESDRVIAFTGDERESAEDVPGEHRRRWPRVIAAAIVAAILLVLLPPWHELIVAPTLAMPAAPALPVNAAAQPAMPADADLAPPVPRPIRPAASPAVPAPTVPDVPAPVVTEPQPGPVQESVLPPS